MGPRKESELAVKAALAVLRKRTPKDGRVRPEAACPLSKGIHSEPLSQAPRPPKAGLSKSMMSAHWRERSSLKKRAIHAQRQFHGVCSATASFKEHVKSDLACFYHPDILESFSVLLCSFFAISALIVVNKGLKSIYYALY